MELTKEDKAALKKSKFITEYLDKNYYHKWSGHGGTWETIVWNEGEEKPTKEEFDVGVAGLQAEYDAQEYARNRVSAYDSVGDQLDMVMKDMRDGTTTHKDACEAVKAKYPKPE